MIVDYIALTLVALMYVIVFVTAAMAFKGTKNYKRDMAILACAMLAIWGFALASWSW